MNEPLTPPDPKPGSNEFCCENCQTILPTEYRRQTIDGGNGCSECVVHCNWCGNDYFREDMFDNPYLGYVCDACKNCEDYIRASEDEIIKHSLRCLFDATANPRIEYLIIELAIKRGYNNLGHELKNDL